MPRLLPVIALAGALVGLSAAPASADLTLPTVTATPLPSASLPVEEPLTVPTLDVPTLAAPAPAAATPATEAAPGPADAGPADTSTPKISLPPAPAVPSLPGLPGLTLPGGEQSPPSNGPGSGGTGGTSGGSPLGDDVLPAEVQDQLCTILTTLLGPIPEQIKGLPKTVVDELPAQITDLVPADVLATVTLQCPTAAPAAAAPVEVQQARHVAKAPKQRTARDESAQRVTPAGLASLPHTGLVAAIPVLGVGLLLLGLALRHRAGCRQS